MQLSDFAFVKLGKKTSIPPFHCSNEDLNGFLMDDAKKYLDDLMAATYLFIDTQNNQVAAYFSLLNDKVAYDPSNRTLWNKLNRFVSNRKRRRSYPSEKIGRLAVAEEYKNNGLGSSIIDLIKWSIINDFRFGCRFLTVDAYSNAVEFYLKNGFQFFSSLDALDTTRLMYFDLKTTKEQIDKL